MLLITKNYDNFQECTEKTIGTKMLAAIISGNGIWGDYNVFLCVCIITIDYPNDRGK